MSQLIAEIWEGLRAAGLPEVMLYLPDQSASRCHWDDTTMIGAVRVALIADQERKIVRILPVESCTGIGIASPKGTDPSGYRTIVYGKLSQHFGPADAAALAATVKEKESVHRADPPHTLPEPPTATAPEPAPATVAPQMTAPPAAAEAPAPRVAAPEPPSNTPARPDPIASRWGVSTKPAPPAATTRYGSGGAFTNR